jgi:hypothetical protein
VHVQIGGLVARAADQPELADDRQLEHRIGSLNVAFAVVEAVEDLGVVAPGEADRARGIGPA